MAKLWWFNQSALAMGSASSVFCSFFLFFTCFCFSQCTKMPGSLGNYHYIIVKVKDHLYPKPTYCLFTVIYHYLLNQYCLSFLFLELIHKWSTHFYSTDTVVAAIFAQVKTFFLLFQIKMDWMDGGWRNILGKFLGKSHLMLDGKEKYTFP